MSRRMRAGVLMGVVCSVACLLSREARACSPQITVPVPTDPARVGLDHTPPRISSVTLSDFRPGYGDDPRDSCRGLTWFLMNVVAEDDQTPPERLRYRLQDLLSGYWVHDEPVPYLFNWAFLDPDEPVELAYRVFVLDEAGNQSEPFEVYYPEREDEGCGLSRARRRAPAWGLTLVALAACLRRRR